MGVSMTRDEIQAAIRRLLALDKPDMYIDVLDALMGRRGWTIGDACDTLISLLRDADMSEWPDDTLEHFGLTRLPVDRDGAPICMGDTVYKDGFALTVTGIHMGVPTWVNLDDAGSNRMSEKYHCAPGDLTHESPTIEGLLLKFAERLTEGNDIAAAVYEYAKRLRGVMS